MSKKIIALLFVAIMLPAVLFGCLDDEEPEETEPKLDMSFNFYELAAKAIRNAPENGEVALDLRNSNRNLLHRIVFEAWENILYPNLFNPKMLMFFFLTDFTFIIFTNSNKLHR